MAFGAPSLKGRALRYLAQREHSRAELARKLARHAEAEDADAAQAQINLALDELAAAGLLSDARAAESVLMAQGRRYGSRRLKQVMQGKGLAPELVSHTLQQARATEFERAQEVWRRRFGATPADAAEHARQARFLLARGFDTDVIRRLLKRASD
ncbi:MAG: recombination regulator RecX [Rubrivivax sp.]|jgi:regulatory protein|nr:recombination regulator RecX [Rubrivivax sp.]